MSDVKRRTQRSCKRCGKIYFGGVESTMCPECARISRAENVIRERICADCGRNFPGGPRARRCPECRKSASKDKPGRNGPSRPLGSIDVCQMCGKEYIVKSGMQKFCPECKRDASLAWQRTHKKEYNKRPEVSQDRKARRGERQKICIYCQLPFWDSSTSNLCSEYCRKKNYQILRYQAEIKRGKNCNIQALEQARQEYREKVRKDLDLSDTDGEDQ